MAFPFSYFPLHFETGTHPRTPVFLEDSEYSKALDCLTKACTDLLVIDHETKKVLIGKRRVHPQPDWWYGAGGRMKPGENCFESASRILKRELGVVIPPLEQNHVNRGGRFLGVGAYSYTWEMREQLPKTNGCADISVVLAIEVSKTEIASFRMDNVEYETHAWLEAESVMNDLSKHEALRRSVADYLKTKEWMQFMSPRVMEELDNQALGQKVREFTEKWKKVDDMLFSENEPEGEVEPAEKKVKMTEQEEKE